MGQMPGPRAEPCGQAGSVPLPRVPGSLQFVLLGSLRLPSLCGTMEHATEGSEEEHVGSRVGGGWPCSGSPPCESATHPAGSAWGDKE